MYGHVSRELKYEDYENMSVDDLNELINNELMVNESYREEEVKSKYLAEHLERIIYICPKCGLSSFKSNKNEFECMNCHYKVIYNGHNQFESKDEVIFKSVNDWYMYQENYINNLDLGKFSDVIYSDKVKLTQVFLLKSKKVLSKEAKLSLFNNQLTFVYYNNKKELPFDDISGASVLGKNKLNLYYKDEVYQIKGDKSFNAVKYMHFYYHYKNTKGDNYDSRKFLGL